MLFLDFYECGHVVWIVNVTLWGSDVGRRIWSISFLRYCK